ncbi:ribosome-binding protein 1-like isoform X6 [Populus alba x Populus x berolinensis]|uniref:Ribosome-binding protein 1-like isoform X6 n=1 Tax=Populus alba x Populus x berolinensis TaxID=444605 RepID=A0AAD6LWN6_9ROSI|nr:ribosome-binding protein 1-like isoform X6 [Populus alba x Populus x berolinensis]
MISFIRSQLLLLKEEKCRCCNISRICSGVKDASDKKILVDMLFWAVDNPAPANYLLISGDRDFSNALHQLRMRRYNILLAQPPTASAALVAAAKSVWLWKSLLAGGRPLPEFELQQLRSKNYTSSPGTTQIPVSGAAQMKEPVDSYSEKPYVANQKSPSTSRGARGRANATQRNPSQTNASKTTNTPFYPTAPPPMPARPNGTSYTSAPSTRVPAFDSLNNFGHPASSSPQPRNPELKHDPKNKPDSKKNKKSKGENSKGSGEGKGPELKHDLQKEPGSSNKKKPAGENSKGSGEGKGPELSQNKKNPEGENSKGSGEGKGPELKHDLQKEPGSSNKKKPAGENSKGSGEGKGPQLSQNKKNPEGENSKGSGEGKGPELKHDLQKEPGSSNKKKPAGENSKGSCEGKGPQLEHDPQKKPEGENKKKQDGKNSKGFCAGKEQELSLNMKNPEGENSEGSGEGKGPELKHDPQKKPRSRNRKKPRSRNGKKPEGEDSKGSGEGKGPELKHDLQNEPGSSNKKKPRGENSKGSCEGEGPELKHDPQKKPEGENSRGSCEGKGPELKHDPHKKPEGENSRGSCEGKGPELKHDPDKKPEGENKKKQEGENSRGSCEGKGPELKHDPGKKPEGENKKVARARKGVSLKKSVVPRSKIRVSLTKLDKGKKNPPAAIISKPHHHPLNLRHQNHRDYRRYMSAMDGGGGAYVNAKTSVWWDIENCAVPRGCDPHAIARNISSALVEMNYFGPVSISAYGDTHGINSTAQQALSSTGIALNHVPEGVKDASDKKILVDMLFWAVDNPAPANYLLISGDRDFSSALHQLRMRRYNILLAQPKTASVPLVAAAKNVWLWTSLLAGGRPLPEFESQQLRSKNYTSSPGTTQIPGSGGAAQMKEPVDSYSGKPYVANQKSPSTSRGARGRANTIQRNPSQTKASKTTNTPFYPSAPPPMPDATQIKEPVFQLQASLPSPSRVPPPDKSKPYGNA